MEALHEHKDPSLVILACLLETLHGRNVGNIRTDVILDHTTMCKFALFYTQPSGCAWSIWKKPEAEDSNYEGGNAFKHEEPAPT